VIDNATTIEGSSNWTETAFDDNFEADTISHGEDFAREKLGLFPALEAAKAAVPVDNPQTMVALPQAFLTGKTAGKMLTSSDRNAFDLYLYMLHQGKEGYLPVDYRQCADQLGITIDEVRGDYRRQVRAAAIKLKNRYGLIDYTLDKDFNLQVCLLGSSKASFKLPDSYWTSGASKALSIGEKFFCLVGYYQQQEARPNPYWSRSMEWLAKEYGIERTALSCAAMALRRRDILEIIFTRAPDKDYKNKEASRYRMKGFVSSEEQAKAWQGLSEEFGADVVLKARGLNKMIDEDENNAVARAFAALIKRYGYPQVLAATRKVAAFVPQNPLRNARYIEGVIKGDAPDAE